MTDPQIPTLRLFRAAVAARRRLEVAERRCRGADEWLGPTLADAFRAALVAERDAAGRAADEADRALIDRLREIECAYFVDLDALLAGHVDDSGHLKIGIASADRGQL
jgi:hypothetical protein